jgi:hypothetical protein
MLRRTSELLDSFFDVENKADDERLNVTLGAFA